MFNYEEFYDITIIGNMLHREIRNGYSLKRIERSTTSALARTLK